MNGIIVKEVEVHSPAETQELGKTLGQMAIAGDLFLLKGELGAGKTCLVQGIAQGLNITEPVRSPTFVLATEHRGRLNLYHIDLYRLDDTLEVDDLGLEDYFEGDGLCAVEWADKAMDSFPAEHLLIEFETVGQESRRILLKPVGDRYVSRVRDLGTPQA